MVAIINKIRFTQFHKKNFNKSDITHRLFGVSAFCRYIVTWRVKLINISIVNIWSTNDIINIVFGLKCFWMIHTEISNITEKIFQIHKNIPTITNDLSSKVKKNTTEKWKIIHIIFDTIIIRNKFFSLIGSNSLSVDIIVNSSICIFIDYSFSLSVIWFFIVQYNI